MADYYRTTGATDDTWHMWAGASATSGTSVWGSWTADATTSTSSTTSTTWLRWIDASASWVGVSSHSRETAEERQARIERIRAREAERQRVAEERRRERAAALERAEELLQSCLDEVQQRELVEKDCFVVRSEKGKLYEVRRGEAGNVYELDDEGKRVASYCIHPRLRVPVPDTMLAQKILLEHNESHFLQVANRTRLRA